MNVMPSSQMTSLSVASATLPSVKGTPGFMDVVQRFIQDTNAQQLQADKSVELLATGQSESIHETMLALTKADLSLRVFMEVRNKVMDAYQEVMRMQL